MFKRDRNRWNWTFRNSIDFEESICVPAHPKSFACTLSNYNARTHNVLFCSPVQVSQISCIRLAKGLLSVLYQLFHYIQLFLFYTITRKSAYICEMPSCTKRREHKLVGSCFITSKVPFLLGVHLYKVHILQIVQYSAKL